MIYYQFVIDHIQHHFRDDDDCLVTLTAGLHKTAVADLGVMAGGFAGCCVAALNARQISRCRLRAVVISVRV